MAVSLSALASTLEVRAREFRSMTFDTVIGETAGKPINEATARALEDIAGRVRQIDRQAAVPDEALAMLRALADELDEEVRQASSQMGGMPDIASFFLNPMKLFSELSSTGRIDGIRQAAEILKEFLHQQENKT